VLLDAARQASSATEIGDHMPIRFSALIKLSNGTQQRVEIVADTWLNARLMIESQYGRGVIISGPIEMRGR
jgi:hypothetical protein